MSSRPMLAPQVVITAGDMSQATVTSIPTIVQNTSMLSYDCSWSGSSPVGAITIQVSNTYSQNADGTVKNAGNWTTLTLSNTVPVSGNTGGAFIDVDATAAYAVRLVYTKASGTGTISATIAGKST